MTKGIDMLVKIDTTVVALQKGATLNRSADTVDVTTKSSAGWKEFIQSFKEWSIDCDGLYTLPLSAGTDSFSLLEDHFEGGLPVAVSFVLTDVTGLVVGDTTGFSGSAIITDFPLEAPMDDSMTFSISLQGTGALAPIVKAL